MCCVVDDAVESSVDVFVPVAERRMIALHLRLRSHASWSAIWRRRLRILAWLGLCDGIETDEPVFGDRESFLKRFGLPHPLSYEAIADAFALDYFRGELREENIA